MMKKIFATVLLLSSIIALCACKKEETPELRVEDIRAIGKLATLECHYNNVAKKTKKADNIFEKERVMWIEYEGVVKLGIDTNEIEIEANGTTVKITMPEAQILSSDYTLKEETIVANKDGIFKNKITAEEQKAAVAEAQLKMEETALKNEILMLQAQNHAKKLIENHITNLGKAIGAEYTIEWASK